MKTPGFVAGALALSISAPALAGDEIRLTHNLVDTRVEYGTIAGIDSSEPLTTRDNTWWRLYARGQFALKGEVRLTRVRFGVEQAACSVGWQPITVKLYAVTFPLGEMKMTEIESVTEYVRDQTMSLVSVPVDVVLAEGADLAVSVAPADFGSLGIEGGMFFIGTNRLGQTGPSLISCPSAGDSEPVPYASVADEAQDLAIVMTVFGETLCEGDCDGSGNLDFFDFLCFITAHASGDPAADCDGSGQLDMFDLVCFQDLLAGSCD